MNIGIDIDDTITKTTEEFDIWAKEYTENVLNRKFELNLTDVVSPLWARCVYGWTDEEDNRFWDMYYEKTIENLKPKENAIEVINRLSENNKIIISKRSKKIRNLLKEIISKTKQIIIINQIGIIGLVIIFSPSY